MAAVLSIGAALPAQQQLAPAQRADAFRIGLHQPNAAESALYASHDAYTVRLDANGMRFQPVLGPKAPHARTLQWQTVRIGELQVTADDVDDLQHTDWRGELRYGNGVVEAYDVQPNGVEQTFVFATPPELPASHADLVIAGAIDTTLAAAPRGPQHAPIEFCNDRGIPVVSYGEAFAIDANDQRINLATSFDGEQIRILVPTQWLRSAAYPVVVDPLTSRSNLAGPYSESIWCPQVAHETDTGRKIVAYSRAVAADDYDAYVRLFDAADTPLTFIYWGAQKPGSARDLSVAWVKGSASWVIAINQQTASSSSISVRIHPTGSIAVNGGQDVSVPQPLGFQYQRPVVGGGYDSTGNALLVFERDPGFGQPDTNSTKVMRAVIDTDNFTVSQPTTLQPDSDYDAQRPSVNQMNTFGDDWCVVWQERNTLLPNDDWDIALTRVNSYGSAGFVKNLPYQNSNGLHSFQPKVGGTQWDYFIAYLTRPFGNTPAEMRGTSLRVQHIAMSPGGSVAYGIGPDEYVVDTDGTATIELHDAARSIAMDETTESHFVIAWRRFGNWFNGIPNKLMVARYGEQDQVLESHELESDVTLFELYGPPSVCDDHTDDRFSITYGSTAISSNPAYNRYLEMPDATALPYGNSCAGALSAYHEPYAGTRSLRMQLVNANPSAATWLWAALAPANLPLPALTNCPVLLDPTAGAIIIDQDISTQNGNAVFYFGLPAAAAGVDLYVQSMQLVFGDLFDMSNGLQLRIR